MKKFFVSILSILILCLTFNFFACNDNEEEIKEEDVEVLYQNTTIKKQDSIFSEELFSVSPQTKEAEVEFGSSTGLKAFKYKSVGFKNDSKDLEATWVFAVIGVPDQQIYKMPERGFPAVILVHGGGGKVYTEWIRWWTKKGFIALAFDTYSQQINKKGDLVYNPEGGPESSDGPLMDKIDDYDNSWLYHNVINIIYCNNILRQRSDVDTSRVCLTGISWGSVLCEVASGIDDRFAAIAPVYGSGYLYSDSNWINEAQKYGGKAFNYGDADGWKTLFDPSEYLQYCAKPVLFVSGIDDQCFSTINRSKTYSLPAGKVFYAQHYNLGHGHVWQKTPEIFYFFRHVLYGEEYDLSNKINVSDGVASLSFEVCKADEIKFIYTTSKDADSHKWSWSSFSVYANENGEYIMDVFDDVTAFYFEMSHTGDEYYKTSTELIVKGNVNDFI